MLRAMYFFVAVFSSSAPGFSIAGAGGPPWWVYTTVIPSARYRLQHEPYPVWEVVQCTSQQRAV